MELSALRGTVADPGNCEGGAGASTVVQHLGGTTIDVTGELASPMAGAGAP